MIVLDEQLLGRGLERDFAQWYRGTVQFITDLRPHTLIKDEAIPVLLRRQAQPTFVTINERDFWRQVATDQRYCIVCFVLSDARAREIPLAFEDLHWIDSETQALLNSLVESLPTSRLLLLVNYRPEYQHGWGSRTYYTPLRLDPLPPVT
jgi:predicted ATPase